MIRVIFAATGPTHRHRLLGTVEDDRQVREINSRRGHNLLAM